MVEVPHQTGEHRPIREVLGEARLIVVTGKGGVGKTTMAAALGLLAAASGRRTIVVECDERQRLAELFGVAVPSGREGQLADRLWSTTLNPERALIEWLRTLSGRFPVGVLESSESFQHFVAAAPGAKELISMVKVAELLRDERWGGHRAASYELAILDAPASGHALAMLSSPRTFAAVAGVGPLAGASEAVRELLAGHQSAYVAVAQASEMAVTETLELAAGLQAELGREFDGVIVNGTMPRRFSEAEMELIEELPEVDPMLGAARRSARSAYLSHRAQHAQIARLRRRRRADGASWHVMSVPFSFQAELDLAAVRGIAALLERRL